MRKTGRGRTYNIDTSISGDGDDRVKGSEVDSWKERERHQYTEALSKSRRAKRGVVLGQQ